MCPRTADEGSEPLAGAEATPILSAIRAVLPRWGQQKEDTGAATMRLAQLVVARTCGV